MKIKITPIKKVTVIVPNYNHEPYLRQRLDSILNQTYTDFDVILLDDNSTDNSRAILEEYKKHPKVTTLVYNDKNTGSPFKQWVKGLKLAESEYVWIAESDDYATPDFLVSMIALTETHPNVGIAYCNSYKVDDNGNSIEDLHCYMEGEFKSGPEEVKEHLCLFNTITNVSSCLIKRDYAMKAITGLGNFRTCGDWIFYARVLQYGNLAYTCKKLNHYRWHPKSISFSASKTSIYISEGINVMKYIDFTRVKFTLKEFLSLYMGWVKKILHTSMSYILISFWVLFLATWNFCSAKLILSMKN